MRRWIVSVRGGALIRSSPQNTCWQSYEGGQQWVVADVTKERHELKWRSEVKCQRAGKEEIELLWRILSPKLHATQSLLDESASVRARRRSALCSTSSATNNESKGRRYLLIERICLPLLCTGTNTPTLECLFILSPPLSSRFCSARLFGAVGKRTKTKCCAFT